MDSEQQQNKKILRSGHNVFDTLAALTVLIVTGLKQKNQGLLCSITVVLFLQCQIKSVQPGWREKFKNFQL